LIIYKNNSLVILLDKV